MISLMFVYLAKAAIVSEALPVKSPVSFRQRSERFEPTFLKRNSSTSDASRMNASKWGAAMALAQHQAEEEPGISNSSKNWFSEAEIIGQYGKVNSQYMIQHGFFSVRQNPNKPDRIQFCKNWIGEEAFRELYNANEIATLFAHNLVKIRMVEGSDDSSPKRTQYLVEGAPPQRLTAPWSLLRVHGIVASRGNLAREAPLSENGYQQVAALKDDPAMMEYTRRWLKALQLRETSEDRMAGFVPWFSGTLATQSLAKMLGELRKKDWVIPIQSHARNKEKHDHLYIYYRYANSNYYYDDNGAPLKKY